MHELLGTLSLEVCVAGGRMLMAAPGLWLRLLEAQYFSHRKAGEERRGFMSFKEMDAIPILRLRQHSHTYMVLNP